VAAAVLLVTAACAHATAVPPPLPDVAWPAAPAAPRVRLARVVSSPDPAPDRRSFWRSAWRVVVGAERDDAPQGFQRPFGVAAGTGDELLAADPDARRVTRLGPDGARDVACGRKAWAAPMAVALGADGVVYVADAQEGVVARVAPDGVCTTLGAGALGRPTSLAVAGDRIFVADPPRHEVVVLSASGERLAALGHHGEGDGALNFPTGVALDRQGNVLVVDALNFRVARFSPDGRWLGAFGASLDDGGQFALPKGVAAGADGRIYVSDAQRDLVLVFGPDGEFEYGIGAPGEEPGRFMHPAGLATAGGRLYVADSYGARLQVFEILGAQP
jgi:DNA-binding beta-propeller fold protein YncE